MNVGVKRLVYSVVTNASALLCGSLTVFPSSCLRDGVVSRRVGFNWSCIAFGFWGDGLFPFSLWTIKIGSIISVVKLQMLCRRYSRKPTCPICTLIVALSGHPMVV